MWVLVSREAAIISVVVMPFQFLDHRATSDPVSRHCRRDTHRLFLEFFSQGQQDDFPYSNSIIILRVQEIDVRGSVHSVHMYQSRPFLKGVGTEDLHQQNCSCFWTHHIARVYLVEEEGDKESLYTCSL
jgi:hypothetical protein